jgi:hypothetical protein
MTFVYRRLALALTRRLRVTPPTMSRRAVDVTLDAMLR